MIDKLLAEYKNPGEIIGENGLLKERTKEVLERALRAEPTEHLGYEKQDPVGQGSGNWRNGKSRKKQKRGFRRTGAGDAADRNGTFEPRIVAKGQTRFAGFDAKIVSMYSRG